MYSIHPVVLEQVIFVEQSLLRSPEFNRRAQQLRDIELHTTLRPPMRRPVLVTRWIHYVRSAVGIRHLKLPLVGAR